LFLPLRRQILVAPWWFFFHQQKDFFWVIEKKALGGFFFSLLIKPCPLETTQWAASGVFLLFSQRHQVEIF
jgi:hypothetical protein